MSRRQISKRSGRDRSACPEVRVMDEVILDKNQCLSKEIRIKEKLLENKLEVTLVHQLVKLYTKAIETYELQDDLKFLNFQEKLHKMLIRPEIIIALQDEAKFKKPRSELKIEAFEEQLMDRNIKNLELNKKYRAQESNKRLTPQAKVSVRRIVDEHRTRNSSVVTRLRSDSKSQDRQLERRLAQREKVKLERNNEYSLYSHSPETEPSLPIDESENLSTCASYARFAKTEPDEQENEASVDYSIFFESNETEKILEGIMERSLNEKVNLISEIKIAYEIQMRELEGDGSLISKIKDKMKIDMSEEIKKITLELDNKRKEEMKSLKEEIAKANM